MATRTELKCPKCGADWEHVSTSISIMVGIHPVIGGWAVNNSIYNICFPTARLSEEAPCSCGECGHEGTFQDFLKVEKDIGVIRCDCCDCYHRTEYHGDCRNDAERFADIEEAEEKLGKPVVEVDEEEPFIPVVGALGDTMKNNLHQFYHCNDCNEEWDFKSDKSSDRCPHCNKEIKPFMIGLW